MNKYKVLAKNTVLVFLGTFGSSLISFLMLPLYTRWLTTSDYGTVDTISTYASILVACVFLNISDSIFIFPKKATELERRGYFSSGIAFILLAIVVSSLFFYVIISLLVYFGQHNVLTDYPIMIFIIMCSTVIQLYCQAFTRSIDKMLIYSMTGIVTTFSVALFSILLIPYWGLKGYVASMVIASLAGALFSVVFSKSYRYFSLRSVSKGALKQMLGYSVPLVPNSAMWWIVNGLNRPIMEHFLSLASIGIYAVASKFAGLMQAFMNILSTAWTNSALDEYGCKDFENFYNSYLRFLITFLFIGLYILIPFSKPIIELLTTPEYYTAYRYMPILAFSLVLSGISGNIGAVFAAAKKSKYFFYSSLYAGSASLLLLLVFTPMFGLMGVVCSLVGSYMIMLLARLYYSRKYVRLNNKSYYVSLFFIFLCIYMLEMYVDYYFRYLIYFCLIALILMFNRQFIFKFYSLVLKKNK